MVAGFRVSFGCSPRIQLLILAGGAWGAYGCRLRSERPWGGRQGARFFPKFDFEEQRRHFQKRDIWLVQGKFFFLTLFLGLRGPSMAGPSGPGPASFWAPCLLEGASAAVLRGGPVLRPRCRSPRGRSRVFVLCGSAPPHLSRCPRTQTLVRARIPLCVSAAGPVLFLPLWICSSSL